MTDLKRHSEEIWRSIYIFTTPETEKDIREYVEKLLEKLDLKVWSFCYYGEVVSEDEKIKEDAHITYRIAFPGTTSYDDFRKGMEKAEWKWEDHGYDEPLWVKLGYVIGTRLYKEVEEARKNPDVPLDFGLLQIIFHGFFNDIRYNSREEAEAYFALFSKFMAVRFGLRSI